MPGSDIPLSLETDEAVRILRLSRPDKLNALNRELIEGLAAALRDAEADDTVRAVVLCGQGRAFSAGADLKETAALKSDAEIVGHAERFASLFLALTEMSKPSIAAVDGFAFGGGCGLAFACDLIVAGEDASFGFPEITRNVMPALVTPIALRRAGRTQAFAMLALGERHDAAAMQRIGLVGHLVPAGAAEPAARRIARELAGRDPRIVAAIKSLLDDSARLPLAEALARARVVNAEARRTIRRDGD